MGYASRGRVPVDIARTLWTPSRIIESETHVDPFAILRTGQILRWRDTNQSDANHSTLWFLAIRAQRGEIPTAFAIRMRKQVYKLLH